MQTKFLSIHDFPDYLLFDKQTPPRSLIKDCTQLFVVSRNFSVTHCSILSVDNLTFDGMFCIRLLERSSDDDILIMRIITELYIRWKSLNSNRNANTCADSDTHSVFSLVDVEATNGADNLAFDNPSYSPSNANKKTHETEF